MDDGEPGPEADFKALGYEPVELPVVEDGFVSLPAKVAEALGLVPGDILALKALPEEGLGLEVYRTILGRWDVVDPPILWYWIEVFLRRPLTAVEPEALFIPAEVFPLTAGEKVELRVSSTWYSTWTLVLSRSWKET